MWRFTTWAMIAAWPLGCMAGGDCWLHIVSPSNTRMLVGLLQSQAVSSLAGGAAAVSVPLVAVAYCLEVLGYKV